MLLTTNHIDHDKTDQSKPRPEAQIPSSDDDSSLDSEDDYCSGSRNVNHQQVFLKTTLTRTITQDRQTIRIKIKSSPRFVCSTETLMGLLSVLFLEQRGCCQKLHLCLIWFRYREPNLVSMFPRGSLVLCAPNNRRGHFHIIRKWWTSFVRFLMQTKIDLNSEKCIEYGK